MTNGVHSARIDCNTLCWSVEKQDLELTRRSRPAACRAESLCFYGLLFDLSRAVAETPQVARKEPTNHVERYDAEREFAAARIIESQTLMQVT
jgi:hypothetical protein